jgi:hypothetical protein
MAAVEAFAAEGWAWGGRWRRSDQAHFQAAQPPVRAAQAARGGSLAAARAERAALIAAVFPHEAA